MTLKSKIFYNFVKHSYQLLKNDIDKEEVYWKDDKLVVVVKDKKIGQEIFKIVNDFVYCERIICPDSINFKIDKYFTDKNNVIEIFCISICLNNKKDFSNKLEKLKLTLNFINDMEKKGYILDENKFKNETAHYISDFLSFFKSFQNYEEKLDYKGCLIKYIHYTFLKDSDLEKFYTEITSKVCKINEFPYGLPLIKMCYNYFDTKTVPDSIFHVLIQEETYWKNYKPFVLILSRKYFDLSIIEDYTIIEDNEDYIIVKSKGKFIKIYHNMLPEFEKFLQKILINDVYYSNDPSYYGVKTCIPETIEQIKQIFIDFTGNIIGYELNDTSNIKTIFEKGFYSQKNLIENIEIISKFIFDLRNKYDFKKCRVNCKSLEKALIFENYPQIKIIELKQLFEICSSEYYIVEYEIYNLFLKNYSKMIDKLPEKPQNKKQLLNIKEIRYLSPLITREIINYYFLGKTEFFYDSKDEFFEFINNTKTKTQNSDAFYDSKFIYDPTKIPFIFDYEAEEKYGIKIKDRSNKTLPDGRRVIYPCHDNVGIFNIKQKEDDLKKFGDIEDDNVKIVGISEIIYSKEINYYNTYYIVGYIVEPIEGKPLTNKVLKNLSNKDLLKVASYLFSKFKFEESYHKWISLESIWRDSNFHFYIDNFSDYFWIEKKKIETESQRPFIEYLIEKGCNPNIFIAENFSLNKNELIEKSDSYDTYCKEHKIYFKGSEKLCPICKKTIHFVPDDYKENASKIFEDKYAKHYSIDENYNLKVYKTSCRDIDIDEIEKSIDKILLDKSELEFGQICFIPYKKAITNDKFIGYIYEKVEFSNEKGKNNVCINIKSSKNLSNLPRIMTLIRLILQIKEITNRNLGFTKNPFTNVFLNKAYKGQVQILNIEFLSKEANITKTINWTYEYICKVITSDIFIEIDVDKDSDDLDSLLKKLQYLSKQITQHCHIHDIYYKSFCPKCISKKQYEKIEKEYVKKSKIIQQKPINKGGESIIYPYKDNLIAKVFKEEINNNLKTIILSRIFDKKEILEKFSKEDFKYEYIIIEKMLIDKETDNIFGYTMKQVTGKPLSILKDIKEVKELGFTRKDILEILITVGKGIETLHNKANIYIGDLNGRNILFDTEKNVYFIDFDGMGVDEFSPMFFTQGYIDPISMKNQNITMEDDWYSFAIQAFYYLTLTHPFNGLYYIEEDGIKKYLEIPDKMELKKSLLGNHGMEVPDIAIPWDWMNEDLKTMFLNIFEGDNRESIVPYLISQYEEIYGEEPDKFIRINSKFIAKEINYFGSNVVNIINYYSAICSKEEQKYVAIIANKDNGRKIYDVDFPECTEIKNVLLTENKQIAIAIYENKIIAIDLESNSEIFFEEICKVKDIVVNENTLYFSKVSDNGKNIILQIKFLSNGGVKKEEIDFLTEQFTKCFFAKFNSKFILVKNNSEHEDSIYCNSQELCVMSCKSNDTEYKIMYDEITKLWSIINSDGNGIVINAKIGKYKKINIKEYVNKDNIKNVNFYKENIYIPSQDCIYIINVNDKFDTKKMHCDKIVTPDSQLYNINKNSFYVLTNKIFYKVYRG